MTQKLYIANTSKHVQELHFWVLGSGRPFVQTVPMGGQIQINAGANASAADYAHIIEQLATYGLIPVKEIGREEKYSGLCYQFDKPIDIDSIKSGLASNDEVLEKVALEQRKIAAASTNANLQEVSRGHVSEVDMSIEEQQKQGDDADILSETISVTNTQSAGKPTKKARQATN